MLHTLFKSVSLSLNDVPVTSPNSNYAYRAYLETLLSYGAEAKKSYLQSEGFYKDTANHMETFNDGDNYQNKGYKVRKELCSRSREVELKGRLRLDMFQQPRLLLNGTNIKLVLYRNSDVFCLLGKAADDTSQNDYKKATFGVKIMDASLELRKVSLSAPLALHHGRC